MLKHPLEEIMNEEERIKILRFPSILGRDVISRFRLIFDRVKGELLLKKEEKEEVAKQRKKNKKTKLKRVFGGCFFYFPTLFLFLSKHCVACHKSSPIQKVKRLHAIFDGRKDVDTEKIMRGKADKQKFNIE